MQITSAFCLAQQATHTQRAAESSLANVRTIATRAAAAWGVEAVLAARREARVVKRQVAATNLLAIAEEPLFSENPDRGFADGH